MVVVERTLARAVVRDEDGQVEAEVHAYEAHQVSDLAAGGGPNFEGPRPGHRGRGEMVDGTRFAPSPNKWCARRDFRSRSTKLIAFLRSISPPIRAGALKGRDLVDPALEAAKGSHSPIMLPPWARKPHS